MLKNKKIGLVLSGGGMHGFAQIGALKVLEEKGIKPDLIVGTSVGSLVGAAMASGKSINDIETAVLKTNILKFIRPTFWQGIVKGDRIAKTILKIINVRKFEELNTKLVVNATDIAKGEEVVFDKGPLLPALSASISIPGIFTPVKNQDALLVDGGVYDNLCLGHAKDMDIIIAINVSKQNYKINSRSSMIEIMRQSISYLNQRTIKRNIEQYKKDHEIILIEPDVSNYGLFEYRKSKQKEMIKIGEREARKILEKEESKKLLNLK